MATVPDDLSTGQGPPTRVPLAHFLVGLGFLLAAGALGLADAAGVAGGSARPAHRHLLLAGWVCVTIVGAMTQFVPVWTGVGLYSRRLAVAQLPLFAGGVAGIAVGLLVVVPWLPVVAGLLALVGVLAFVVNVGLTLHRVDSWDATLRRFAFALVAVGLVALLGVLLATDLATPLLGDPVSREGLRAAHATLAVFGVVLSTVYGALYQLATMFTGTDLDRLDRALRRTEGVAHPAGVLLLAGGRLVGNPAAARVGGALVLLGVLAVAVVLARRLRAARVPWTPVLSRYAVVAVAAAAWVGATAPGWLASPLGTGSHFGPPPATPLLLVGVVGFVVLGTLYHVVPFLVWLDRYSDRVGREPVPMVDDLYDDRLARLDLGAFLVAVCCLAAAGTGWYVRTLSVAGWTAFTLGAFAFVANLLLVVARHWWSPLGLAVGRVERDRGVGPER